MSTPTPDPRPVDRAPYIPSTPPATASVAYYSGRPDVPAPRGSLFSSVCWLVARHPVLVRLARRVPGVVDTDGDVLPWVLADAVRDLDEHRAAWARYERDHAAPRGYTTQDEDRYDAWLAAGPAQSDRAAALGVMSRTELARLRLLATFDTGPTGLCVPMLDGWDYAGADLLRDWMTATTAYLDLDDAARMPLGWRTSGGGR